MEQIGSLQNPRIKHVVALQEKVRVRKEENRLVAEGLKLLLEGVEAGLSLEEFYVTEKACQTHGAAVKELSLVADDVFLVRSEIMQKMSDTKSPQGALGIFSIPHTEIDFSKESCAFLVLEGLQDPGNLGTLLRTADALSMDGVILMGSTVDLFHPKVVRGAMGALFRVPTMIFSESSDLFSLLREENIKTYGAVLSDSAEKLSTMKFAQRCAIFVGNEGQGLLDETVAQCDHTVMIDMPGRAESLNASVAGSILLWELSKQKHAEVQA